MMIINNAARTMKTSPKPLGLYLHIPFCIQKCNYCDFLSFGGTEKDEQTAYIKSIIREIEHYGAVYRNKYYVETVFIGGGTPSLLESDLIRELMDAVKACFNIGVNSEISMECNPKTLTEDKLKTYRQLGINRLSIGAQSFHEKLLITMGRVHSAEDFYDNYSMARACGFQNINIDLMFSIPGQTMEIWMTTLEQAVRLAPEHISFYSLQLEEGTPFFKMLQEGNLIENDDELDREMYHNAVDVLKSSGYEHYEISNAAKEGYQCRHNLKYWSMEDYLGLGLGAHSYMEGTRFSNVTDLDRYIQIGTGKNGENISSNEKEAGSDAGSPWIIWHHKNTDKDNISEYLFTGMRKLEGIDLKDFKKRFHRPLEEIYAANWHKLQRYIDQGYLIQSDENMHFTLKGIDISNSILSEFV